MSSSHVETFQFAQAASPSSGQSSVLPVVLSLLAGTLGSVSTMVYVSTGLAAVAIVESTVLAYFFRRIKA
jgi:hypothetical protein